MSARCRRVVGKGSAGCRQDFGKVSARCRREVGNVTSKCRRGVEVLARYWQGFSKWSARFCRQKVLSARCQQGIGEVTARRRQGVRKLSSRNVNNPTKYSGIKLHSLFLKNSRSTTSTILNRTTEQARSYFYLNDFAVFGKLATIQTFHE